VQRLVLTTDYFSSPEEVITGQVSTELLQVEFQLIHILMDPEVEIMDHTTARSVAQPEVLELYHTCKGIETRKKYYHPS